MGHFFQLNKGLDHYKTMAEFFAQAFDLNADKKPMSTDALKRLDFARTAYQAAQSTSSASDVVRELQEIKNEVKIANDENASAADPITNALHSPYLPDQKFYKKDVVLNSSEETMWKKELPSYEEVHSRLVSYNLKRLNIL